MTQIARAFRQPTIVLAIGFMLVWAVVVVIVTGDTLVLGDPVVVDASTFAL